MGTRARLFIAALAVAAVAGASAASAADLSIDFTWSPEQPGVGDTVTFTAQSNNPAQSYEWDFGDAGDGQNGQGFQPGGQTVTHTFTQPGGHRIRLRITDTSGQVATRSRNVRVSSMRASFTWSPQSPLDGDVVTLTSTSSGPVATWAWSLDDVGAFDDGTTPEVQRAFPAGDHTVGLRVEDADGGRATTFQTLTVGARPTAPPPPAGQKWLSPFPSVRIRGQAYFGGARLSLVAVRAPAGASVQVRCRGSKRCPKTRKRTYVMQGERLRLRGHERFYPDGTILQVYIWKPGEVGKYTRFRIRKKVAPVRTDRCLYPGGKWPGRCPG